MNRLQRLADPLLRNPVRPTPALDALEDRVRQRRAGRQRAQLALVSVFVVVLIAGTALAVRQDQPADVLTGPPGTTTGTGVPGTATSLAPAPAIEPSSVELAVSPASGPVGPARTLTITNNGEATYAHCAMWSLQKWNGTSWDDVGTIGISDVTTGELYRQHGHPVVDCSPTFVAAGDPQIIAFHLANAPFWASGSRVDEGSKAIEPGIYELFDSSARGRFEITALPTNTSPTYAAPGTSQPNHGVQVGTQTIDLNPGTELQQVKETLPTDIVALDDRTISVAWTGGCNQPADHVELISSATDIELRLSTGYFAITDCMGEPDHWVVTFDTGILIAGRPITARATVATDTGAENTEIGPFAAAPDESHATPLTADEVGDAAGLLEPTSMLLQLDPLTDGIRARLSYAGCWPGGKVLIFTTADGRKVPQVFARNNGTQPCHEGPPSFVLGLDGSTVFGAPSTPTVP